MLIVAAAAGLSPTVAITFAVLGAAFVGLGGMLRLLEGGIKLGPSGLEVQLRERGERAQEVIEIAEGNPDPEVGEAMREAVRYIDPTLAPYQESRRNIDVDEVLRRTQASLDASLDAVSARLNRLRSAPVHVTFNPDRDPPTLRLINPLERDRLLERVAFDTASQRGQTKLEPTNATLPVTLGPRTLFIVNLDAEELPDDLCHFVLTIDEELSVYIVNDDERARLKQRKS